MENKMDPQMIFLAGLQVAYWLWGGFIQPTTVRFGTKVADALGDVVADRIYRWFGEEPPAQNGELDTSAEQQNRLEKIVLPKIKSDPNGADDTLLKIQGSLVTLLRDRDRYSIDEIYSLWQYLDPKLNIGDERRVGKSQAELAGTVVNLATRRNKLPELINEMRKIWIN
jgi:hypothetical protein